MIYDLALTLKNESHDVFVSNIIVRNDNDSLSKKGCEVNAGVMELRKKKIISFNRQLKDQKKKKKKIKPQPLNTGKLHLN